MKRMLQAVSARPATGTGGSPEGVDVQARHDAHVPLQVQPGRGDRDRRLNPKKPENPMGSPEGIDVHPSHDARVPLQVQPGRGARDCRLNPDIQNL